MVKKEINKKEIKDKLKVYFKKCATGRIQLRCCVIDAMDAGFSKEEILVIPNEMIKSGLKDEASLCSIIAIGPVLGYEAKHKKVKLPHLTLEEKNRINNKLKQYFKKCGLARKQLRKCIFNALNAGLAKEELLAMTDDLVGGLEKNEVSVCAIIAVDEVLKYKEMDKLKKTIKMYAPYMEFKE